MLQEPNYFAINEFGAFRFPNTVTKSFASRIRNGLMGNVQGVV